jgi:hypothetical protein
MRRVLAILVNFGRKAGGSHPNLDAALENYTGLLAAMGKSEAEIGAARMAPEARTSRTVFSDLFVVPATAGTQEKVVKSAALPTGFARDGPGSA